MDYKKTYDKIMATENISVTEDLKKMVATLKLAVELGFLDSFYAERAVDQIQSFLWEHEQEYEQARFEAQVAAQEMQDEENVLPF